MVSNFIFGGVTLTIIFGWFVWTMGEPTSSCAAGNAAMHLFAKDPGSHWQTVELWKRRHCLAAKRFQLLCKLFVLFESMAEIDHQPFKKA